METSWSSRLVSRMLGLLLAAAALGMTFNRANPLGLSWQPAPRGNNPPAPVRVAGTTEVLPAAPVVTRTDTQPAAPAVITPALPKVTASIVPAPRTAVKPAPAHYQNESLPVTPTVTTVNPYQNQTLTAGNTGQPTAEEPVAVTWTEAQQWMTEHGAVLVDARRPSAFQAGAIPGAVSLPFASLAEVMPAFQQGHNADTWIVVYCSDEDCGLSMRCAQALMQDYGFRHVAYLAGGFTEWQRQQVLPATETPAGAP